MDKQKVLCPQGHEMILGWDSIEKGDPIYSPKHKWVANYHCECGWRSPNGLGATPEDAIKAAYEAATLRPPNKPLTAERIMELDDFSVVWSVYADKGDIKNKKGIDATMHWKDEISENGFPADPMLFSSNPTAADIEAARKEQPMNNMTAQEKHINQLEYLLSQWSTNDFACPNAAFNKTVAAVKAGIAALQAQSVRPPNEPLTKEQIMAMDDLDAVWLVGNNGMVLLDSAAEVKNYIESVESMGGIVTDTFYAHRPMTIDDIEADTEEY